MKLWLQHMVVAVLALLAWRAIAYGLSFLPLQMDQWQWFSTLIASTVIWGLLEKHDKEQTP